jgi:hypothetical protein
MARLFTHGDGRLKTGRVAVLVFAGLLTACAMLFKVNSSVDHALVAVKHVFEPEKVPPAREKPHIKQKTARVKRPETTAVDSKMNRAQEKSPTESIRKVDPSGKENKETRRTQESTPEKPPPKSPTAQEKPPLPEKSDAAGEADSRKEPTAVDPKNVEKSPEVKPQTPESEPKTIDVAKKPKRLTGETKEPTEKSPPQKPESLGASLKEKFPEEPPRKHAVTVDQKRYKEIFHSWRMAGKKGKGKEKLPLRVENLRDSYELFQMKPVAVIRGNLFFDLTDGTRVAEKSLAEYSGTVFRVDRPWDKWGKALAAAGIRPGENCEVRYYMYDFIKEAIYARVNQAFLWCRKTGLISETLPPDSVDILGRAYVINRRGGGRFGVFVPVSLDTRDGRRIVVNPDCFQGQADVEALHQAGLL